MHCVWSAVVKWWFWDAFWPNFVAMLVGALIGILGAYWIYKVTSRENQRLADLVRILSAALEVNAKEMAQRAQTDSLNLLSDSQVDIWDTLKPDVQALVKSPELRSRLASHFELVDRVDIASRARTERTLAAQGRVYYGAGAEHGAIALEAELANVIRGQAQRLATQATQLRTDLMALSPAKVRGGANSMDT
jgi:hypothetical protein